MGAWGPGTFENDDALDWVWSLDEVSDYSVVVAKLEAVASVDDAEYLESYDAAEALAAAETVAVASGHPPPTDVPESVSNWMERIARPPSDEERAVALMAIARVRRPRSELLELWKEADADEWVSTLDGLEARLRQ